MDIGEAGRAFCANLDGFDDAVTFWCDAALGRLPAAAFEAYLHADVMFLRTVSQTLRDDRMPYCTSSEELRFFDAYVSESEREADRCALLAQQSAAGEGRICVRHDDGHPHAAPRHVASAYVSHLSTAARRRDDCTQLLSAMTACPLFYHAATTTALDRCRPHRERDSTGTPPSPQTQWFSALCAPETLQWCDDMYTSLKRLGGGTIHDGHALRDSLAFETSFFSAARRVVEFPEAAGGN